MWWRLKRSEFEKRKGAANKRAMRRIVSAGEVPGILAYDGDEAIGWCAIGPRERHPSLERSRVLARVDQKPVWSIVCFFVARPYRRHGVSVRLLKAAVDYARAQGARIIEGYPVEPKKGTTADAFVWTGTAEAFRKAGFREVLRRSETRPIMRRRVRPVA
jgi:GNAT superfamily N-acetyltransferase